MVLYEAALDHDLSRAALRVLIVLEHHYNATAGAAWPTQETIAGALSTGRSRVAHSLAELREAGYVVPSRRGKQLEYRLVRPGAPRLAMVPDQDVAGVPVPAHDASPGVPDPAHDGPPGVPDPAHDASPGVPVPARQGVPDPAHRTLLEEPGPDISESDPPPAPSSRARARATTAEAPPKARIDKGTRLPDDWQPTAEMVAGAMGKYDWSAAVVADRTESFCNYFLADRRKTKTDWNLTWWTWLRNSAPGGRYEQRIAPMGAGMSPGNLGLAKPLDGAAFNWT